MKQLTGGSSLTNDVALLMHFIGSTKPESMGKIRLNDRELKLFGGTRSSLGDTEALLTKVANGQSLTPKQRSDMISTMTMIAQAEKRGGQQAPAGADNEVYIGGQLVGHTVGGKYVVLCGPNEHRGSNAKHSRASIGCNTQANPRFATTVRLRPIQGSLPTTPTLPTAPCRSSADHVAAHFRDESFVHAVVCGFASQEYGGCPYHAFTDAPRNPGGAADQRDKR